MTRVRPIHLLYVVYWGAAEPLGQALVIPPLLRLSKAGIRISLITFEKPADLENHQRQRDIHHMLGAAGVTWRRLRYWHRPVVLAKPWDVLRGYARGLAFSLPSPPDIVLGRTFIGGIMGRLLSSTWRKPFVFHNEGFWPDEQVDAGKFVAGSWPYRTTKAAENWLYRTADAVITLSQFARDKVIQLRPTRDESSTRIVPSCVDLERFRLPPPSEHRRDFVYVGSLGGRYRTDLLARFFKFARLEIPGLRMQIYSPSSPGPIQETFDAMGVERDTWSLGSLPHERVPAALATHQAGLHFLAPGINGRAGSPTKIGEYWACGLPTITTPGMGDVDNVVRDHQVGVILEDESEQACRAAARTLHNLLTVEDELGDSAVRQRCRRAAERFYSLEAGVETQLRLFRALAR